MTLLIATMLSVNSNATIALQHVVKTILHWPWLGENDSSLSLLVRCFFTRPCAQCCALFFRAQLLRKNSTSVIIAGQRV